MKPTKAQFERYFDVMEEEVRNALQEVIDSARTVGASDLADLIATSVAERMRGMPMPTPTEIRKHVGWLFDPDNFDDENGADPLATLKVLRRQVCG